MGFRREVGDGGGNTPAPTEPNEPIEWDWLELRRRGVESRSSDGGWWNNTDHLMAKNSQRYYTAEEDGFVSFRITNSSRSDFNTSLPYTAPNYTFKIEVKAGERVELPRSKGSTTTLIIDGFTTTGEFKISR